MIKEITPVTSVNACIVVPGSKSITNRALICAALAKGESLIRNASDSEDTLLMANGLNQLGVLVRPVHGGLSVEGTAGRLFAPKFPIPVGNAGTTLRFMLSLAALAQGTTVFEVGPRMAERPMGELVDALRELGANVVADPRLPRYRVTGASLHGGNLVLGGERSSQFLTSLLLVGSYASSDMAIEVNGTLSSVPYIHLTRDVMMCFGVQVEALEAKRFIVRAGQRYQPMEFPVEPDASAASYFLAAAAIAGGRVRVEGLGFNSSQGDAGFLEILKKMGVELVESQGGLECAGGGVLEGVDIDMNGMPDIVPTLAVTALFARTPTRIRNVAHLRYKESDRLAALSSGLRKLGATVTTHDDGLEIVPTPLHGALLDTYDDHRLAMSFALTGLRVPGVKIENPNCVKKSFPGFWKEFERLTAKI